MTAKTKNSQRIRRGIRAELAAMAAGPPRGPIRVEHVTRRRKATAQRPAH